MKATLRVCNMRTAEDINSIRRAISVNEGVIACQIDKEKQQVNIVYDNYFLDIDNLMESLEDLGYTVLEN